METPETIKLLGGRLCLDFANSVDWRDVGDPLPHTDALTEPDSLERWARRLRLDEPGAEPLPRAEKPSAHQAEAGGAAAARGGGAAGGGGGRRGRRRARGRGRDREGGRDRGDGGLAVAAPAPRRARAPGRAVRALR